MEYTLLEKIIMLFDGKMNTPRAFGIFHIASMLLVISVCALAIRFRHKFTEKNVPYIILAVGIVMFILEIYKQLVISYDATADAWQYKWYIFPFQFCSTPIYITLLAFAASRLKNKLIYNALKAFLSTYALIAGIVVFCVPGSVFCPIIGVNIQTMVHHGLMIILAVALLSSGTVVFEKKTLIGAFSVFIPLLVTAMILNFAHGNGSEFDMFYLAPDSTFVLAKLRALFWGFPPYPVYLIGYVILFTLGASLVLYIGYKVKNRETIKKTDRVS